MGARLIISGPKAAMLSITPVGAIIGLGAISMAVKAVVFRAILVS